MPACRSEQGTPRNIIRHHLSDHHMHRHGLLRAAHLFNRLSCARPRLHRLRLSVDVKCLLPEKTLHAQRFDFLEASS